MEAEAEAEAVEAVLKSTASTSLVLTSLKEALSIGPSIRPSICNYIFRAFWKKSLILYYNLWLE